MRYSPVHEHHIHEPDEECHDCIAKGYKSGLEAAIENTMSIINTRLSHLANEIDDLNTARDLILDHFNMEFFEVDEKGEPI